MWQPQPVANPHLPAAAPITHTLPPHTPFCRLYQGVGSRLHMTAYAAALEVLRDAALRRLPMDLTSWFAQLPEETKFHKDVGESRG